MIHGRGGTMETTRRRYSSRRIKRMEMGVHQQWENRKRRKVSEMEDSGKGERKWAIINYMQDMKTHSDKVYIVYLPKYSQNDPAYNMTQCDCTLWLRHPE